MRLDRSDRVYQPVNILFHLGWKWKRIYHNRRNTGLACGGLMVFDLPQTIYTMADPASEQTFRPLYAKKDVSKYRVGFGECGDARQVFREWCPRGQQEGKVTLRVACVVRV